MNKLILIPMLAACLALLHKRPQDVFIIVFLPFLTLLPTYFNTELVPGTPEIYFWSAALIPIFAAWGLQEFEGYRYHWMDIIIFGYILMVFWGQWVNSDYKQAQKGLFNNLMSIMLPYMMVRAFCGDHELLRRLIKTATILGAIIAIFNIIEMRIFVNYFDEPLRRIWPGHVMWDTGMVMSRWGFKRAFGPFSHPIVSGYFFCLVWPLALWCQKQKLYSNLWVGRAVMILNAAGIFTSLSRAPIFGFFLTSGIVYLGWSKNRAAGTSVLAIFTTITLIFTAPQIITYMNITRANAKDVNQRNVAYRKEMWEAYIEVALERPVYGWGRFGVPSVRGMDSIDSQYLGIALSSGLIALGFYLIFLLGMLTRLLLYALARPPDEPQAQLAWCLIAGWASAIFNMATVYSGAQTIHYLFMLGAVGQTILLTSPVRQQQGASTLIPIYPAFRRTL